VTATRTERGLALLVGGGLAVIFIVWGALHVAGWTLGTASRSRHQVIPRPAGALRIAANIRGDVAVEAGPGPDVTVDTDARGGFRAPGVRVDVSGSTISVDGGCGSVFFDRCHASVTVRVPPGTPVQVSSGSGDVSASGLSGRVQVAASSGDLSVSDLSGHTDLSTGSGDVDAQGLSGTASLETSSGDIEATGLRSGTVRARTGSGDVDLFFSAAPAGVDADTGSGDVSVLVPRGGPYNVDAETSSGDRVVNVATDSQAGKVLRARTGSGDVSVLYGS
jgi:hypothetical protein